MAATSNRDQVPEVYRRTLRFVFDVEVVIKHIPQAVLDGTLQLKGYRSWDKQEFNEFIVFQKRLLDAILQDPAVVERLTVRAAQNDLLEHLRMVWGRELVLTSEKQLIAPILPRLSAADQARIREGIEEDTALVLYHTIDTHILSSPVADL